MKKYILFSILLISVFTTNTQAEIDCKLTLSAGDLVSKPEQYLNKEFCLEATFHSFGQLALEYPKALRTKKDNISLTVYRPDTTIPLGELKLAYNIKKAKDNKDLSKLKKDNKIKLQGKVFSTALGEPWVDITDLQLIN